MRILALTIALVCQASCVATEAANPESFCWDASVNATGYRVYWSTAPDWWPSSSMTETTDLCTADPTPEPIPGEVIFFVVTAYNANGESETGHGPIGQEASKYPRARRITGQGAQVPSTFVPWQQLHAVGRSCTPRQPGRRRRRRGIYIGPQAAHSEQA